MVPRTFPSTYETVNGETRMVVFFLSSVSGLTKWVDYIPVKFPMLETQVSNSYNNDGVVLVDPLSSTTNKQAWIDYIPVFVDANDTAAWRVNAIGYIPVGFAVKPTLNLDFAGTKTLDSRITFTRASSATYFDADGVLQTAASGVARFDHNPTTGESLGLLVEEQRTNLLTYSAEFDNAAWAKVRSSITANAIVAPDGTLTGDTFVEDTTASNTHLIRRDVSVTSGTVYTYSLYAKAAGRTQVEVAFGNDNSAFATTSARFTLSGSGTATTIAGTPNATIISVGNGWYRLSVTATATATASASLRYLLCDASGNNSYTGDGYSGIYIWGAQLEAGAFPTSYIPTTSAQVTRAADVATVTGTNFSSWFNENNSTMYAQFSPIGTTATSDFGVFTIDNGTFGRGYTVLSRTGIARFSRRDATGQVAVNINYSGTSPKAITTLSVDSANRSVNGSAINTDATVLSLTAMTTLRIGFNNITGSASVAYLNGHIQRLSCYPILLTNEQLVALTQ